MDGIAKIENAFKKNNKIKLMTHIVGGYPSLDESADIIREMAANGADLVEIQIPFSDPTADGPSIVNANTDALLTGVSTDDVLEMARNVIESVDIPILLMSYINPVFAYGIERFVEKAKSTGIAGFIIPDCPPEENIGLIDLCNKARIAFVPLVAPTTSDERISYLSSVCNSPFVYAVMRLGVTGKKTEMSDEAVEYLSRIKKLSSRFVAAGFGIRDHQQIVELEGKADCAVVGSAVTDCVRAADREKRPAVSAAGSLVKMLKTGNR